MPPNKDCLTHSIDVANRLGNIEGTLSALVKTNLNYQTQLSEVMKNHQNNKEQLQEQITTVKVDQAKFAVWIRLTIITIGGMVGMVIKKVFF